ncbi:MAG: hypothetical protein HQL76_09655 [Magnetococcales bacterium]|nr:hypothetical protein [Magnetococcales bacterium]
MTALAILIALISLALVFIPLLGGYLTLIPGLLTLLLPGRLHWAALAIGGMNVINILFLSPILRTNAVVGVEHRDYKWAIIYLGLALFQGIVALVVHFRHAHEKAEKERRFHAMTAEETHGTRGQSPGNKESDSPRSIVILTPPVPVESPPVSRQPYSAPREAVKQEIGAARSEDVSKSSPPSRVVVPEKNAPPDVGGHGMERRDPSVSTRSDAKKDMATSVNTGSPFPVRRQDKPSAANRPATTAGNPSSATPRSQARSTATAPGNEPSSATPRSQARSTATAPGNEPSSATPRPQARSTATAPGSARDRQQPSKDDKPIRRQGPSSRT